MKIEANYPMKRVIIDADPGIDDAAAIFLALASPELSVEAITTIYGNGPVETCANNALRILHAADRLDIPVYQGAGKPLLREATLGWASPVHGNDALGNISFPLPEGKGSLIGSHHTALEIIDWVMAAPGEVTLLALGRMTNIALALSLKPRLAQAVAEIVLLGGSISTPGNVSPVASANLYEDPEATAILYASGAPLVQVGMDVCDQVEVSQSQLDRIRQANTPITRLLTAATPCLQSYYRARKLLTDPNGVHYNDVPAVAYAIDPSLFGAQDLYVAIETQSPLTRGQTVADRRNISGHPPNARVCLEVDAPRLTALFTQRVAGYCGAGWR
jgi:inosine-uridine nucleoside N-ribohydrolase